MILPRGAMGWSTVCACGVFLDHTYILFTPNFPWLILVVMWVGTQCVIMVFPGHTHLLLNPVKCQNFIVSICLM